MQGEDHDPASGDAHVGDRGRGAGRAAARASCRAGRARSGGASPTRSRLRCGRLPVFLSRGRIRVQQSGNGGAVVRYDGFAEGRRRADAAEVAGVRSARAVGEGVVDRVRPGVRRGRSALWANWGGGSFTARAAAGIGQWMMNGGEWEGRQLVTRATVKLATTYAGMPKPDRSEDAFAPGSGLAWYTNSGRRVAGGSARRDRGGGGAAPGDRDCPVAGSGGGAERRRDRRTGTRDRVLDAGISGDPRAADGRSDGARAGSAKSRDPARDLRAGGAAVRNRQRQLANHLGDDNEQYTSYGDGFGFDPRVERKLGMGFARIVGPADAYRGENVRSNGERTGDGAKSPKASGILMVDGVLYLWVRNTGNAELWRSKDRGKTWESGFRMETSFGSPTFLNFGRNYAGARDGYVYTYSQDGPSAYESDNRLIAGARAEGPS